MQDYGCAFFARPGGGGAGGVDEACAVGTGD
jgi:hypothetical protein